jgi:flagellar basal body-associated protein FliL
MSKISSKDDWGTKYASWKAKKHAPAKPASSSSYTVQPAQPPAKVSEPVMMKRVEHVYHAEPQKSKWLMWLAFAIPVVILLVALYIAFMPFGYSKNYTLGIASDGKITSNGDVRLTNAKGTTLNSLSSLYGSAAIVVNPPRTLHNATVNVSIQGNDVYLAKSISFKPDSETWNTVFDFTSNIPSSLKGSAVYDLKKQCAYFAGNSSLNVPNSQDQFENGAFTVYAVWTPENSSANFQEIVGHYNWELVQNDDSVKFQVGRVAAPNQTFKNLTGAVYTVSMPVSPSFFKKKHTALAIYNPSDKGYIELWVDNKFGGMTPIGNDTIWKEYNEDRFLSLGKSDHGVASYFTGCINEVRFAYTAFRPGQTFSSFLSSDSTVKIPIAGSGKLDSVSISIEQ